MRDKEDALRPPLCLDAPPTRYWIASDLDNITTAHNLRTTGALFSMGATAGSLSAELAHKYLTGDLDYLPYIRNPGQDKLGVAPFAMTTTRDYTVEVLLETVRKQLDQLLHSRLS